MLHRGIFTSREQAAKTMTTRTHGLYSEEFEHDSCGFGLIANIDDVPSHWLVHTAVGALREADSPGCGGCGRQDR